MKKMSRFKDPNQIQRVIPIVKPTNPDKVACSKHLQKLHAKLNKMPPIIAMIVHDEIKKAFMAGMRHEKRKHRIIEVGGYD